jgi:ketosteroid isomerase-like protein
MAHPNEEILRTQDEALAKGDMDTFWSLVTDDVLLHVAGRSSLAGDFKGKERLQEVFGRYMASLGENPEMITHDILANDEHGIVLYETRVTKDGESLTIRTVNIAHLRDGKISELWTMDEDPYTADPVYG